MLVGRPRSQGHAHASLSASWLSSSRRRTSSAASSSPIACSRCSRNAPAPKGGRGWVGDSTKPRVPRHDRDLHHSRCGFCRIRRRRGAVIRIGAVGMLVAIRGYVSQARTFVSYWEIVLGMIAGGTFGAVGARRVKMTAMPQMVALFKRRRRRSGGADLARRVPQPSHRHPANLRRDISISLVLSALIGSISFTGSMVAFAKLQELIRGRPITYPGQKVRQSGAPWRLPRGRRRHRRRLRATSGCSAALGLGAGLFGILFVLPIGGADMPGRDLAAECVSPGSQRRQPASNSRTTS